MANAEVPGNSGTRKAIAPRLGFGEILVEPGAALRLHFAPKFYAIYRYTSSTNTFTNLMYQVAPALNRHDSGVSLLFAGLTSSDYIYFGVPDRIGGMWLDMTASSVNATTATLALDYLGVSAFTNTTISAGHDSGGAALAQDGSILISTVPAAGVWVSRSLVGVVSGIGVPTDNLFWFRISSNATIDAGTSVDEIATFHWDPGAGTATGGSLWLKNAVEYTIDVDDYVGGLEFIAEGGSATTANLTWIRR